MSLTRQFRIWIRQMVNNLGEPDWASRHVGDPAADPSASQVRQPLEDSNSNLAMALSQIGLVRYSSESLPGE